MRVVKVIFLVLFIKFTKSSKNSEVIGILEEIINSSNSRHVTYVNLLTTENYVRNSSINDFINEVMRKLSKFKFVMRIDEKVISQLFKKRILMTVILTHSLDDFLRLTSKFTYFHFHYSGFYVVLFENAQDQEVSKIFKFSWDIYIHNINLIRFVNASITVETYFPFTPSYCNKTTPVQIAKYENGKFQHKPEDYFPKKFKNFFECPIKIASVTALSPSILKREFSNGSFELYGRDIEMLKTLSHELNFYANNTYLHPYGSWGQMFPNKTMSGAMGMAQRRDVEFAFGNLNLKVDRTEIMDHSLGYTLETLVFMIPKGRPMSAFHKLLRPFDNFVWISILFVLILSTIVIAFLSLLPRKLRNFVYGERVTTPFMNLIIAMYGGAQTILPRYNFARSLLMMFLLFCLVLRSLYQGALFQYLQASDNEPEVESIEEMASRDFKFFTIPSYDDMLKNNSLTRNRRAVIQPTDMKEVMDRTLNPFYAGCVMNSITEILYRNKLKARNREPLYTICKQSFTFIPITMWFPKNSYLIESINDKLLWYQCSGLIRFWASFEEDHKFLNPKPDPKGPTPLSLENFSATFQIWIYSSGLACLIFIVELFWNALSRKYLKQKYKQRKNPSKRAAKSIKMAKIKLKVIIPKK